CERRLRKGGTDAILESHAKWLDAYAKLWICLIRYPDASSSDYQLKYEVELCSLVLARLPGVFWLPRVGGFWQSCRWTFAFQSSAFGKSRADGNKLTPSTVLRVT